MMRRRSSTEVQALPGTRQGWIQWRAIRRRCQTQQSLWCNEPASSLRSRQRRRDGTQQGPVLVGDGWSVVLAVQDCELVSQDDDLEVLPAAWPHSEPSK